MIKSVIVRERCGSGIAGRQPHSPRLIRYIREGAITMNSQNIFPRIFKLARRSLILLPMLFLFQCFEITQILEWQDDDTMNVHWIFRYAKALDEMSSQGQDKNSAEGMPAQIEKAKKEIPASLEGFVKNLDIKKIDTEYDSSLELTFQIPGFTKLPFDKMKLEDFPIIPKYLPKTKQIVFNFKPMEKPEEKKKAENDKNAPADGSASNDQSMEQVGKQLSALMLSSVRYQIFIGKKFNPEKIFLRQGKTEKKVDVIKIGDMTLIDLPLFAIFGEGNEPFDLVIQMKN
jgi:hypothetical protein